MASPTGCLKSYLLDGGFEEYQKDPRPWFPQKWSIEPDSSILSDNTSEASPVFGKPSSGKQSLLLSFADSFYPYAAQAHLDLIQGRNYTFSYQYRVQQDLDESMGDCFLKSELGSQVLSADPVKSKSGQMGGSITFTFAISNPSANFYISIDCASYVINNGAVVVDELFLTDAGTVQDLCQ